MMFDGQFGRAERLLHRFAFRTRLSQVMLADLEERAFAGVLADVSADRPVFLSGLPRSGSTILLNVLSASGRFATHTYQDMPFVLCPLVWSRFSRRFQVDRTPRERAHGDGIRISGRSPEAFEEMIWKHFFPRHYRRDRILPWTIVDHNQEFEEFFLAHMKKVIVVRGERAAGALRYLSKNNANIARLSAIPAPLRRGIFIIPFREPIQQAASLLRQHRRFSALHAEHPFTRQYMEAIGHHDFGLGLRPIDFGGWLDDAEGPDGLEFWLRYWSAAYGHVLAELGPSRLLVSYARLTEDPEAVLREVAEAVEIPAHDLLPLARRIRPPRIHDVPSRSTNTSVRDQAREIYEELEAAALPGQAAAHRGYG